MNFITFLKDIIAPKKCYGCGKIGSFLCLKCLKSLKKFDDICYICKQKSKNYEIHNYCKNSSIFYDKIIILYHYKEKIVKKLIKNFKFYGKKEIINDFLQEINNELINYDKNKIILIPTPMFWYKKLTRGFNQTEIIIKNLNKFFGYSYDFNIIKKVKSTKPQSHFNKNQRLINLKNCYKIDLNLLKTNKNKLFIIIDDLVSSGTTINEISKILKQNGIKKVYGLLLLLINLFFLLFYIII